MAEVTDENIRLFIEQNKGATAEQIADVMDQYSVTPVMMANALGLDRNAVIEEYNLATGNNVPLINDENIREFVQQSDGATTEEIVAVMDQYGVTPERLSSATGLDPIAVRAEYEKVTTNLPAGGVNNAFNAAASNQAAAQAGVEVDRNAQGNVDTTTRNIQTFLAQNQGATPEQIKAVQDRYNVSDAQMLEAGYQVPVMVGSTGRQAAESTIAEMTGAESQIPMTSTGSQIPTGLRGSEQALKGGATAALAMLDEINRVGRQDLTSGATAAQTTYNPFVTAGTDALATQRALSGLDGQAAFDAAYQESPQMAFLREQGMRANLAGAAATGGLGGGNVQKELQRFGQGLASQGLQNQIANISGLTQQGFNAADRQAGIQANLGSNLAGYNLNTGLPSAQTANTLGRNLASGRTRAGELLADQYGTASANLANLYNQQGTNAANAIQNQVANIQNLNQTAASQNAMNQVGYGTAMANNASATGAALAGVPFVPSAQPNYSNAIGNALQAGSLGAYIVRDDKTQPQQQASIYNNQPTSAGFQLMGTSSAQPLAMPQQQAGFAGANMPSYSTAPLTGRI